MIVGVDAGAVPRVTVAQMVEVDRVMVDELGLGVIQMMENAGRGVAVLARNELQGLRRRRVRVLAGTGGNGGGGLAAARHLCVGGAHVSVGLSARPPLDSVVGTQLTILQRLGVPIEIGRAPDAEPDLTIDALLGYGQRGAPRDHAAALIEATGDSPVLALDVPSGLELATGRAHEPGVRANATLTLAAVKHGLDRWPHRVGVLHLADISVPPGVVATATGTEPCVPFVDSPVVRVGSEGDSSAAARAQQSR